MKGGRIPYNFSILDFSFFPPSLTFLYSSLFTCLFGTTAFVLTPSQEKWRRKGDREHTTMRCCVLLLLLLHISSSAVDHYGIGEAFCQRNAATAVKAGPFPLNVPHDKDIPWVWDAVLYAKSGGHGVHMTILSWTACQFNVPDWRLFVKLIRNEAVYVEQVGNGSLDSSLTPIYDISIFNTSERPGRQKLHKATQNAMFAKETFQCIFADKKAVVIGRSTTEEVIGEFLSLGTISVVCPVPEKAIAFDSMRLERAIGGKLLQTPAFTVCRMSYNNETTRFTSYSTSEYPLHYPHHQRTSISSSSSKEQQNESPSNRIDNTTSLHPFFNLTVCTGVGKGNLRSNVVEWLEYHQVTYLLVHFLTHPLAHPLTHPLTLSHPL